MGFLDKFKKKRDNFTDTLPPLPDQTLSEQQPPKLDDLPPIAPPGKPEDSSDKQSDSNNSQKEHPQTTTQDQSSHPQHVHSSFHFKLPDHQPQGPQTNDVFEDKEAVDIELDSLLDQYARDINVEERPFSSKKSSKNSAKNQSVEQDMSSHSQINGEGSSQTTTGASSTTATTNTVNTPPSPTQLKEPTRIQYEEKLLEDHHNDHVGEQVGQHADEYIGKPVDQPVNKHKYVREKHVEHDEKRVVQNKKLPRPLNEQEPLKNTVLTDEKDPSFDDLPEFDEDSMMQDSFKHSLFEKDSSENISVGSIPLKELFIEKHTYAHMITEVKQKMETFVKNAQVIKTQDFKDAKLEKAYTKANVLFAKIQRQCLAIEGTLSSEE